MKTKIWSLPTRLFHWLLTLGVIGAFLLAEEFFRIHIAFGYLVGTLLVFRIIWGFAGPKYSRFSDFKMGKKAFINTYKNKQHTAGHNPLASLIMIAILVIAFLTVLSGMMAFASEGKGILAFLNVQGMKVFEEMHEFFIMLLVVTVALHLLGLAVDTIKNRQIGTIGSMFTGNKNLNVEGVKLNVFQKIFSIIWIVSALLVFTASMVSANLNQKNGKSKEHKKVENHERERTHH